MKSERVILVVTDGRDYSIKEISEWLLYYSKEQGFRLIILDVSRAQLIIESGSIGVECDLLFGISDSDEKFSFGSIIGVLFRQAGLSIDGHTKVTSNSKESTNIKARLYNYLMAYEVNVRTFILNCFSEKNIIGYDSGSFINKLEVLKIAAEIGLKIPETILTTNRSDLEFFCGQHDQIVIKSVALNLTFFDLENNISFRQLTHSLNFDKIKVLPEKFQLSMAQRLVKKEFEIRTFYLDGECTSWALLSQSNEKTSVDYRNYDWDNPMRVVMYSLPLAVEKLVKKLMTNLALRTGSIDFMYTSNDEYIFLEVNPGGQYGYNSDAGNNYLDKKIAESLVYKYETKKHRVSHF